MLGVGVMLNGRTATHSKILRSEKSEIGRQSVARRDGFVEQVQIMFSWMTMLDDSWMS